MTEIFAALRDVLGEAGIVTGDAIAEKAFSPWGNVGMPLAILRPASTAQVAACLRIAHAACVPVCPWGGLTGVVNATYADKILALSLERMTRIVAIDSATATMSVEAGCVLQTACLAAESQNLFLPLDLGARGSATIGGVISTNAGGNRVLRYGMMRDMVLGVEAVLADGTVIDATKPLMKNNTGYDLKQFFIGSEGTLGVVTRAVLRLRPHPASQCTGFLAVPDFASLPKLLRLADEKLAGTLSAFEVMWPAFYKLVTTVPALGKPVLPYGSSFYVLLEALGADQAGDGARFENFLAQAMAAGLVSDAVIAKSREESTKFWALRDDVGQKRRLGPAFTFDISLAITEIEAYLADIRTALEIQWPGHELVVFGHLGDGNLHVVVAVGDAAARAAVEELIYSLLAKRHGSISAEHGIGLQKRAYLKYSRAPAEIAMMRAIKMALDPKNILNPGKVLEPV
jgi:FAD/FMN-containing dehydrogenase